MYNLCLLLKSNFLFNSVYDYVFYYMLLKFLFSFVFVCCVIFDFCFSFEINGGFLVIFFSRNSK